MSRILSAVLVPFSEYPITRQFSSRRYSLILFCASLVVFTVIAIFNLFTQGSSLVSRSYQQSHFQNDTSSNSCYPAVLSLRSTLYSISSDNTPGGFPWTIGNIDGEKDPSTTDTDTGFRYRGDPMSCNATSASVLYRFITQSFVYAVCVQCYIPTDSSPPWRYVRLCTEFDLAKSSPPTFSLKTQDIVQVHIFRLGQFYQRLKIPANKLPPSAFPPNYNNDVNAFARLPITPSLVVVLSAWLDGISYVPSPKYIPYDGSDAAWQRAPQGAIYIGGSETTTSMSTAFRATFRDDVSGLQMGVAGIGGVRPIRNDTNLEKLVAPFKEIFDASVNVMAIMMDMATADVHGKKLGATYSCTTTHKEWKPMLSLFSIMFANSAGLFATAMAAMIFIASRYDTGPTEPDSRRGSEVECMSFPVNNHAGDSGSMTGEKQSTDDVSTSLRGLSTLNHSEASAYASMMKNNKSLA
ncbi:hypothetical protein CROQUDRAFT_165149 [Cronartium quercuum f. sp. fusiforme G11]|uniref:Uncharacterized protein n=1 Tax=Cronartium quercuum f. sp. fusiforme G11 TaxID=708437 RepID=A0A9P6ND77_9BASI|nr:hypothetical protein CROQUDRAFT_165149 [Cronartium quercuum f. sp. fusiforme G11]